MDEKPILFSTPMIRALLSGKKTQTRRIMKPQMEYGDQCGFPSWYFPSGRESGILYPNGKEEILLKCPYGQPGSRLWVRETFAIVPRTAYARSIDVQQVIRKDDPYNHDAAVFRADWDLSPPGRWRASIHMPRWASRIILEITDIRVERLQDISEEDAVAEGLTAITKDNGRTVKYGIPDRDGLPGTDNTGWPWTRWTIDPRIAYMRLWEDINGLGSWNINPFVWCLTFREVQ